MIPHRVGLYSEETPRREDRRTSLEPVEGDPYAGEQDDLGQLIRLEEIEGTPEFEDEES